MNGELQVLKTGISVILPKLNTDEISVVKNTEGNEIVETVEVEETEVSVRDEKISIRETRFARLKKSLRKRSASIL